MVRGTVHHSSGRQGDKEGEFEEESDGRSSWDAESPYGDYVQEGQVRLDINGKAEIRLDPSALKTPLDRDWRYTIDAQVRDESRRTVVATGTIVAPRQEFQALVELDRGWYVPGDPIVVAVHARSPNDVPVIAHGTITLIRLEGETSGAAQGLEPIQKWEIATGADGRQTLKPAAPRAGRYRLELQTRDSGDRKITTAVGFWVYDQAADYSRSPRPALAIIADRRTYRVGETARLLVVTASPQAMVLLHQKPDKYHLFSVPNHLRILEVPIGEKEVPNFFVEGTVVREGAVHTKTCSLFVPPVSDLLKVELSSQKVVQKPGEARQVPNQGDGQ